MVRQRAVLFAVTFVACSAARPPNDPIANGADTPSSATRDAADASHAALGGSSSYRVRVTCGEERWIRLEPDPFTSGEIRVFARLVTDGTARVEAEIIGEGDQVLVGRALTIRARAPAFDTLVVPFSIAAPRENEHRRFWVRVRAGDPCAAVDYAIWFREPAMVGP